MEFAAGAAESDLGNIAGNHALATPAKTEVPAEQISVTASAVVDAVVGEAAWAPDAMKELGKIPFFVRGKARRNTERFAIEQGLSMITIETLYDAKAHYGR